MVCAVCCLWMWFPTEGSLVPKEHLAMSGEIWGCHTWEKGCYCVQWVEASHATEHRKMHGEDPPN